MTSTPPAPGTSRLVAGVAGLGALVLLAGGVAASRTEPPTAELTTRVAFTDPGAVLVGPTGTERAARQGSVVRRGTTVRTTGGELVLTTGDRDVRLAPATVVTVLDGARQQLASGSALVDARDGRGLQVAVGGVRVDVEEEAMVRLDGGGSVSRVAAYAGAAHVGTSGRRARTEVDALHQVQVPAGALPGRATPLALRSGDAWESRVLRPLVTADEGLRSLVDGFRSGISSVSLEVPSGEDGNDALQAERTLAFALAHVDGTFRPGVFDQVQDGRALGGSWSVVAELAETSLANAEGYVDSATPDLVQAGVAQAAAGARDDAALLRLPGAAAAEAEPPAAPRPDEPAPTSAPRPTSSPTPTPTSPPPAPPSGPLDPVEEVVEQVVDLLPTGLPRAPRAPARTRAPLVEGQLDVPLLDPLLGR